MGPRRLEEEPREGEDGVYKYLAIPGAQHLCFLNGVDVIAAALGVERRRVGLWLYVSKGSDPSDPYPLSLSDGLIVAETMVAALSALPSQSLTFGYKEVPAGPMVSQFSSTAMLTTAQ